MTSSYWDDFDRRINETVLHIQNGTPLPIRRVAVFVTDKCNMRCSYCNSCSGNKVMDIDVFKGIVTKYGNDALIHITGGEPSMVPWLYDYINNHASTSVRFALNSNLLIPPPWNIQRLKVSLDYNNSREFDSITGVTGAFEKVICNIKEACNQTDVSITCTLTRQNYEDAPGFMNWCRNNLPDIHSVFFSVYKGDDTRYAFSPLDADYFFGIIKPRLEKEMDSESLALLQETLDEKRRVMQGVRFPENKDGPCYISMSEVTIDASGNEYRCPHLYMDSLRQVSSKKEKACRYGCNRQFVAFNEAVAEELSDEN